MFINYQIDSHDIICYVRTLLLQVNYHKCSYESLCLKINCLLNDKLIIPVSVEPRHDLYTSIYLEFNDEWFISIPYSCYPLLNL